MRLKITHVTTYSYDEPVFYALQQLRLTPRSGHGQTVLNWSSTISGGRKQLSFDDQFVNHTELVKVDEGVRTIEIVSSGEVEVNDQNGIIGQHGGFAPVWLFKASTPMTAAGPNLRQLAREVKSEAAAGNVLDLLHALSARIAQDVRYETGRTDMTTTAEAAFTAGHGVCQDHAQIMISMARLLGHPARYVSGYLMMNDRVEQDATHAWCEVWDETLGWIGFDVSNGIAPDDRYVRVAVGRDSRDAAPVMGLRQGTGLEELHVSLQVQQ
jgi:transglutaminase-like putative cysteine protease